MKKIFLILVLLFGLNLPVSAEEGYTLPSETAVVEDIQYDDLQSVQQGDNTVKQIVKVRVLTGEFKGLERYVENILTGNPAYDITLKKGSKVVLHVEAASEDYTSEDEVSFFIADIKRENTLLFVTGLFFALLVLIGRKKGVASLVSIGATVALIFCIMMPAVLHGFCPILSALAVSILSTVITIYLVGGFNYKSTSAVLGTSASVIFSSWLAMAVIYFAKLTGFDGEEAMFLYSANPALNFKGILAASMIIAALGALMDTAVSIASTINEIHETDRSLSVKQLFVSGMNVGRDIIGTMSNTLILVYLGSSLPLVLLSNNIDLQKFFNLNQVATEILSALIGSIAILACVPLTAIIASVLVKRKKEDPEFDFDNKKGE